VLARGRTHLDRFRPVLLFALVLATTWAIFGAPQQQYRMAANGLFFFVGLASCLLLGWIRWKLWSAPNLGGLLRSVLLLNLSCLGLYFIYAVVYVKARQAAEDRVTLDACVVLVAILWDVLTSGHGITNIDGKWFPRRSRIYLFFGYVMTIVAIVLFFGS